jgi:hypothetical protein
MSSKLITKPTPVQRRHLLTRERQLNRRLDTPWLHCTGDLDDRSNSDVFEELLDVERKLGHTDLWPHTAKKQSKAVRS